jgi:hypothetical protein
LFDAPTSFADTNEAMVLVSKSFAESGEFGSNIRFDFVLAPIACNVS